MTEKYLTTTPDDPDAQWQCVHVSTSALTTHCHPSPVRLPPERIDESLISLISLISAIGVNRTVNASRSHLIRPCEMAMNERTQFMQSKIDSFCKPIAAANVHQPAQPAESDHYRAPLVPTKKRRIIIHDSDSDEGRAILLTPKDDGPAMSSCDSSTSMRAPEVTTTDATAQPPTHHQESSRQQSNPSQTVPRTIHTETVTKVLLQR